MSSVLVTIDDGKVIQNLKNLQSFAKNAPKKRLFDVGLELLRLSQEQVPHDIGTLQNSGKVEEIGGDVVVGYHEPYAARLHEHPEYRFQKGRKGKYLEDPLNDNLGKFNRHLGEKLQTDIKKAIK